MKTKRFLALVCVALTLATMSVGVFAFQPPDHSPLVDYGAYQIGNFNSTNTCQVGSSFCPVCGVTCYEYVISDADIPDTYRAGSVFAIIDTTSLNRGFNGLYNVLDDDHTQASHSDNNCYRPYTSGTQYIITTRQLTASASTRYTLLCVDASLTSDSGLDDFIIDYVTSVTAHTSYSYGIISPSPVQDYLDYMHSEALQLAYNDGIINASENYEAFNLVGVVVDSVSGTILDALYDINIMGLSLLHLVYFVVALTIVMLIVKVVRG